MRAFFFACFSSSRQIPKFKFMAIVRSRPKKDCLEKNHVLFIFAIEHFCSNSSQHHHTPKKDVLLPQIIIIMQAILTSFECIPKEFRRITCTSCRGKRERKKKFEIVLLFYQLSFARCEYKKNLNLMFSAVISSSNFAASDSQRERVK